MGRPTTREVVRNEIQAMMPDLARALAQALGVAGNTRTEMPRAEQGTTGNGALPKAGKPNTRGKAPTREEIVHAEKVEKMPEGGYADTFEVVPANAPGEPVPTLRSGRKVDADVLAENVHVYFARKVVDGDHMVSVKPVPQAREMLTAAGFRPCIPSKGRQNASNQPRWYGKRSKLPAYFAQGLVARRTIL